MTDSAFIAQPRVNLPLLLNAWAVRTRRTTCACTPSSSGGSSAVSVSGPEPLVGTGSAAAAAEPDRAAAGVKAGLGPDRGERRLDREPWRTMSPSWRRSGARLASGPDELEHLAWKKNSRQKKLRNEKKIELANFASEAIVTYSFMQI